MISLLISKICMIVLLGMLYEFCVSPAIFLDFTVQQKSFKYPLNFYWTNNMRTCETLWVCFQNFLWKQFRSLWKDCGISFQSRSTEREKTRKSWGKTGRDKGYSKLILLSLFIFIITTIETWNPLRLQGLRGFESLSLRQLSTITAIFLQLIISSPKPYRKLTWKYI